MHHARLRLLPLAVLVAALVIVQSGSARSSAAAEHERVPFEFTLTPEQCPDLTTAVTGSGEYFIRTTERVDKRGVTHIVSNITTAGTATDEAGTTYRFNYHNNARITIPPGGFPRQENVTDHFNLVGAGGANDLHVGFTIRLTFAAPGEEPTIEEVSVRGNPACDPI